MYTVDTMKKVGDLRFSRRVFLWSTVFIGFSVIVAILLLVWLTLYALRYDRERSESHRVGVNRLFAAALATPIHRVEDRVQH